LVFCIKAFLFFLSFLSRVILQVRYLTLDACFFFLGDTVRVLGRAGQGGAFEAIPSMEERESQYGGRYSDKSNNNSNNNNNTGRSACVSAGEIVGGSEETALLVALCDRNLALLSPRNKSPDPLTTSSIADGGGSGSGGGGGTQPGSTVGDGGDPLNGRRRIACQLLGHSFQLLTGLD